MSDSNSVAVQPGKQQVATTAPTRTMQQIGEKLFSKSSHTGSGSVATQETTAARDARVTAQDAQEAAETSNPARFAPQHLEMARQTFAEFKSPQLVEWLTRNPGASSIWVNEFVAKVGYSLTSLRQQVAEQTKIIAALRAGNRR